ncbi:pentatricopeptide repeat-containing protein at1g31790 [Phtheirospermum japonicum]|uniref:Pentatricopeptide repeat-containing protein at1g31790 n=1 Tax=Phtheirospermum japonicum TaxID=374723 RepID=A0A830BHL5_9LAMI|nr:pentatricopeptide repeat-containing protein at1g31790 [Phtheirospermum japonicum]
MEVIAPNPHAKPALLHLQNTPNKLLKPNPQIQTRLLLHRPEYKPPKPIRIKSVPKNPKTKPVTTTTSDVLLLMDSLKLPIPADIYTSLIKECTKSGDSLKAIELHQHVRKSGLRLGVPFLNRILLMHVSCGCFEHARQLFDQMFLRDFNSWAIVIAGCVENDEHDEAIKLFVKMLREKGFEKAGDKEMGLSVSGILVCVLKACLCTMDFELGAQVHGWLWKMGYSKSVALSSFLISYYGKAKCFEGAESVFEHVPCRSTSAWTSRIVNYCNDGGFDEAVRVFKEMGREGVRKNGYTFSAVLKACRRMGDIGIGRQVHANLMKLGLESDGYVHCALVDMYGKCGFIKDAARVFKVGRYNASCNAMVKNYVRNGHRFEAIKVLYQMRVYGFEPCESVFDEVKLVCGSEVSENDSG